MKTYSLSIKAPAKVRVLLKIASRMLFIRHAGRRPLSCLGFCFSMCARTFSLGKVLKFMIFIDTNTLPAYKETSFEFVLFQDF